MRKVLSIVLTIVLSLTVFANIAVIPASATTNGVLTYTISNDEVTITDCDESATGTVTIPETIENYPVTKIGREAFSYCTGISNVEIPETVKEIGTSAFTWCDSLESINIPQGVTSIENHLFVACTSLSKIELPDGIKTIGRCAFSECTSLTNIVLPNGTEYIYDNAFDGCSSLTSITIPKAIKKICYYSFNNCQALEKIMIEDISSWCQIIFEGERATPLYNEGKLYLNNEILTSLTIPESVTKINDYAFYNCVNLTTVNIPNTVLSIGDYAFYNCTNLGRIKLSTNLESIGKNAFYKCIFEKVTISKSVSQIGENAFEQCNIKKVYINDIAAWCNIDFANESSNPLNSGSVLYLNNSEIVDLVIPDGVEQIPIGAFGYQKTIKSVEIPSSVKRIGAYAFIYCGLESISLAEGIEYIDEWAFANLNTSEIKIPNGVKKIEDWAFAYSNFEKIHLMGSVQEIEYCAFASCSELKGVYINSIEDWFGTNFSSSVYGSGNTLLRFAKNIYLNDKLITNLIIPETLTSIKPYAFEHWAGDTITLTKNTTDMAVNSFANCEIKNVYFEGTLSEWENMIYSGDDQFAMAEIICICESDRHIYEGVFNRKCNNCEWQRDILFNNEHLIELRDILLNSTQNINCDINGDTLIDIRDLVSIRNEIINN